MQRSIRSSAFLMVLAPTLLPALALSVWFTAERVRDARLELQSRGERESLYLAEASELSLLVGDADALARLAASNVKAPGGARAVLFLDPQGALLAAAGNDREIQLARFCFSGAQDCSGEEQRRVFGREVRSSTARDEAGGFGEEPRADATPPLGRVLLSFDPHTLAELQRGLLINAALTTVGALLIAALIANLVALRLSAPMQQLSKVVSRIRGGDLSARTRPSGTGELRELESGVNAMADRVEAAAAELNRRVDEATAELSRALHEREQRNRELDLALGRAEAASRAKDLFLARMSHELRTPLSTVTGYAHLMQQSESPEQRADFYRPIQQASLILQRTVDDVLEFVRLESGRLALERRVFDLEACVEDAVMMQALAAHEKDLELVCFIGPGLPATVLGDAMRISQVLSNLISNAVKFTKTGVVSVRATRDAGAEGTGPEAQRVLLEIVDTGIGIPPENIPHLFQPFAQADESMTRRFGGSGLGLSIAARIVQALGGEITLDSEPGQGTRVQVRLPLANTEQEPVEEPTLSGTVVVWARPECPHAGVVVDYLARSGLVPRRRAPGPVGAEVDLLVVVEERATPPIGAGRELPVLRLRPVEPHIDAGRAYLADCLPLPLRRRELLSACARVLGQVPSIAQPCVTMGQQGLHYALHCLVVEDNELNRRMIATALRNLGLSVCDAAGGTEALALAAAQRFDLVLLDVHMPGMDGVTLARRLRSRDPALPMYALTANVIGSEERALGEAGVREVLYKPLDEARLHAILARHARAVECEVIERPGIAREEILAELARLERAIVLTLLGGALDTACDSAHQLLGAARLFTRGELENWCLRLETALRARQAVEIAEALERVQHALRDLDIDPPAA